MGGSEGELTDRDWDSFLGSRHQVRIGSVSSRNGRMEFADARQENLESGLSQLARKTIDP